MGAEPSSAASPLQRLRAFAEPEGPAPLDAVLAFYDELRPVEVDEMLGDWDGGLIETGHPGESRLDRLRWAGKAFRAVDDIDPMICLDPQDERYVSDVMGGAHLERAEFRRVSTATMKYDSHPVSDHFRRVSDDLVLGVMDREGEDQPLIFFLSRRGARG